MQFRAGDNECVKPAAADEPGRPAQDASGIARPDVGVQAFSELDAHTALHRDLSSSSVMGSLDAGDSSYGADARESKQVQAVPPPPGRRTHDRREPSDSTAPAH